MENDGAVPVPLVIYGVPFHNVTFDEAVDWIAARIRSGRPACVATANLDFVMQTWRDPELQRILIDADLVLADGFPIVKYSPRFGPPLKERVTGSDLVPLLAERAAAEGFRVYGLGSADGVMPQAIAALQKRFPGLQVAGSYSPTYDLLLEMDHREILCRLKDARPDILFVAFGAPKQEKFIGMHVRDWKVPVAMGVGASFDYLAGAQRRAPVWMQRINLEWFWRMCSDPGRLLGRYLANFFFLLAATSRLRRIGRMSDRPSAAPGLLENDLVYLSHLGVLAEPFRRLKNGSAARELIDRLGRDEADRNVLLDLCETPWLDSLELGALLEINKLRRVAGKRLILYALRPKVQRLFKTCRLSDYFDVVERLDDVGRIVWSLTERRDGDVAYSENALTLTLPAELTAATLPDFERQAEFSLPDLHNHDTFTVIVDAARLDFIDSSGLGFLVTLKKVTQREGIRMAVVNLAAKPRRIFEVAKVDKVLLHA